MRFQVLLPSLLGTMVSCEFPTSSKTVDSQGDTTYKKSTYYPEWGNFEQLVRRYESQDRLQREGG